MSEKDTVEWATWTRIKARCYQPSHNNYPRYGARGITVCERWRSSYDAFLADMGRRPTTPGRWSIDRINNDGPYAPWNCRWATHSQQQRNRSYRGNCGEGNGSAKLTEAQVVQIRAVAKPGLFSQLARQFKVSAPTITDIARGRTWRLVKASPEAIHADCKRERDELQQALERVVNAFDRCDSNRGRFSTVGQHDTRCPKGRVDSPDKWRGEWVCACGAEELDEAIEAARKLTSPEARATGEGKAACYDCGLPYDDPGFCDLVVPPTIWEQIGPNREHPEGGLLCPTCLCRALVKAGVQQTAGRFTSGPLAMPSAEDRVLLTGSRA